MVPVCVNVFLLYLLLILISCFIVLVILAFAKYIFQLQIVFSLIGTFLFFQFDCCGVDDYKDMHNLTKWTRGSALGKQYQTPLHCCHDVTGEYPKVCLPSGDDVLCALTPMRNNSNFEKVNLSWFYWCIVLYYQ